MDKLKSKTFCTIFSIISIFILLIIIFFNIQNYQKEYKGIENNLNRINQLVGSAPRPNNKKIETKKEIGNTDLTNRIIMDYNVYTILLDKNNNILDKISHSETEISTDLMDQVTNIISNAQESEVKINSLYFSKIAYNLNLGNFLIIIDTSNVQQRLLSILLLSVFLFILFEGAVYYFSKRITNWITQPVEDSFKKQKEFIANASHELKTPLAVIMASVDCLEVDKKNEKWLNNLKSESERMNHLITRLLDLSRSENSYSKETYILNNLSKLVEKRTLTFESLAFESNVEVKTNIEKNIMFPCNKNDIDELVGVILDNAIKHSFPNGSIQVNLYKEKTNIILDIINQGEEIPKEECDKIFERFYRRDKSRNRTPNRYGLGLAIAKNIVTNHNGTIKAFSENNHTTFRVTFKTK